jgi:hypothetical protein
MHRKATAKAGTITTVRWEGIPVPLEDYARWEAELWRRVIDVLGRMEARDDEQRMNERKQA